MPEPIKVISQPPPGGSCTLYALYEAELESSLGLSKRVIHSDCSDAHGDGFPSLILKGGGIKTLGLRDTVAGRYLCRFGGCRY